MKIATFDVDGVKGRLPVSVRWLAGCAAILSAGLAATAGAQTYETLFRTCYSSGLPDRVIASCSVLIGRRLAVGQDLATAFKNRGNAYDDKGDHVRAMADFGEALAINAQDAEAFNSRGTIHTALGQYDRDPPSSRGQLPISLGRLCLGRSTPDFHLNCGAAATSGQWAPFWW